MKSDLFWFVASTPFACDLGAKLSHPDFIKETLRSSAASPDGIVRNDEMSPLEQISAQYISDHIRVLLLTPQLMNNRTSPSRTTRRRPLDTYREIVRRNSASPIL